MFVVLQELGILYIEEAGRKGRGVWLCIKISTIR